MTNPTTSSPREAIVEALCDLRASKAADFKDPQHQGQRGQDWDHGLIAAIRVVEQLALTTPAGMDEAQARELLAFTMASRGCKPESVEAVRHACNGHIVKVSADLAVAAIQAALSKGSVRQ